jgi:hypothetical protein
MGHFTKMVSMAKTPEQINKEIPPLPKLSQVDTYPYGLCISLEKEQLDKLGIDTDCETGDMIHFCCMGKVTSKSEREKEDGGIDCRIEIQITDLATENEDGENERAEKAERRYGGDADEG